MNWERRSYDVVERRVTSPVGAEVRNLATVIGMTASRIEDRQAVDGLPASFV
jgi:hypothetical protein